MSLIDLAPFFNEDGELSESSDWAQIDRFWVEFKRDFIDNPFLVNGKAIRVIMKPPRIREFKEYPETFVHIITRSLTNERIYDAKRGNRVHWIKPILLAHPSHDIKYYKWMDSDGICREHYWLFAKDFMVVLKEVSKDLHVVTAFCVDGSQKATFYERFKDYNDGNGNCFK